MNIPRESIFLSALRAFFKTFAVILGIGVAIIVVALGLSSVKTGSGIVDLPKKPTLTVSADAEGQRNLLSSTSPVILRIGIEGIIGLGDMTGEEINNFLLASREAPFANGRVKGIILYMKTPGGLSTDSGNIYRLLKAYKEQTKVPIYAFVDSICASGGIYIACAADKIYSTPDSIIGSVGVRLGPKFNVTEAMTKIGVQALTFSEGKDKDMLNPFRKWEEGEDDSIKTLIAEEYARFVDVVTSNRTRISRADLINKYGAQIFDGEKSQELGFVDFGNASYNDALKGLVTACGIDEKTAYQVIEISPSKSFFEELAQNKKSLFSGKVEHVFPLGPYMTTEMSGKLLSLYQP